MENVIQNVIEGDCVVRPKGARRDANGGGMETGTKVWYSITDCEAMNATQRNAILKKGVVVPLQAHLREMHPNGKFPTTISISVHELFPATETARRGGATAYKAVALALKSQNEALAERLAALEAQLAATAK